MKKYICILSAALVMFAACEKEGTAPADPSSKDQKTFVINASLEADPASKLVFTPNTGDNGVAVTFQDATDHLWAYFRNAAGNMVGSRLFLSLVPSTMNEARTKAQFGTDAAVTVPDGATQVFSYLDNNATPITYNSSPSYVDFSSQDGTFDSANLLHVIVGNAAIADMAETASGLKIADITYSYRTTLLKLELTFPAGVAPATTDVFTLSNLPNLYNKVHLSWGNPGASTTNGNITFSPGEVNGNVATAYITVWGGTDLDGGVISGTVGGKLYAVNLSVSKVVEAGKSYRLARTLEVAALDKWTNDEAGSESFFAGLNPDGTQPAWLSYSGGVVSWTANITGKPRQGTITFTNGQTAKVTQVEPKDFAGTWSVKTRKFTPKATSKNVASTGSETNQRYYDSGWTNASSADVTFNIYVSYVSAASNVTGAYSSTTPVRNQTTSRPNNLLLNDLYDVMDMPASVVIDYDNNSASFGLFVDMASSAAQTIGSGIYAGEPACFALELMDGSQYTFGVASLGLPGTPNCIWLMCDLEITDGKIVAGIGYQKHYLTTDTSFYNRLKILGIQVDRFASSSFGATTLIRANANSGANHATFGKGAAYAAIFQFNYHANVTTNGFTLTKE